ncbi:hypothetical protein MASRES_GEN12936_12130 [Acinetobacter baumannii]
MARFENGEWLTTNQAIKKAQIAQSYGADAVGKRIE